MAWPFSLDAKVIDRFDQAGTEEHLPRAVDPHRTTQTAPCNLLHQQAFRQRSGVTLDERLRKVFGTLATTVLALTTLFTMVNVAICRILG